jgi:hypothetical protein
MIVLSVVSISGESTPVFQRLAEDDGLFGYKGEVRRETFGSGISHNQERFKVLQ